MATSTVISTDPITNSEHYCGISGCERPMSQHPCRKDPSLQYDFTYECSRESDDFGNYEFDYLVVAGEVVLYEDYSGNAANVDSLIERDITDTDVAYVSPVGEWEALDAWRDKDVTECTDVATWWHVKDGISANGTYKDGYRPSGFIKRSENVISDELRTAYVENNDGFLSLKVLDEELTKKYHARLLNWYVSKNGKVRIGSIELSRDFTPGGEALVKATCVNRKCNYRDASGNWTQCSMTANLEAVTRDEMEAFVFAIIRHGNNHAAKWFTERDTFYSISTELGDKITEDNEVQFLFDHQRYCSDAKCSCSEVLADLVPALAG